MSNELAINSTNDIVFSPTAMQQMHQLATLMASSACTVPKHLQGNVGDCFAIALQAAQWKMNAFAVAQKTHLVNGVLGYEAQLVLSVITSMAPTKGRLKFEWFGDWSRVIGNFKELESKNGQKYRKLASTLADEKGCGVRVYATLKDEDEPRVLELLLTQAGVRNSTLWADDPKQQLAYLAIKRWSRLYCPDVIMGVYSADELETIPTEKVINPVEHENRTDGDKPDLSNLDQLLFAIRTMQIEEFKNIDPALYSEDDRKIIRKAMADRKKQILDEQKANVVAEVVPEHVETEPESKEIDWQAEILKCGDDKMLEALVATMPKEMVTKFSSLIDAQYDQLF
jgi:hypothetical protein